MGYYKYVGELYKGLKAKIKKPENKELGELVRERKVQWRKGDAIVRVEKPTRIDKARKYGYKSKQGFAVARVRLRRGGMRKERVSGGRRPKRAGVDKITPKKSIQRIAEERVQKRFPNMEVLGSYWMWEDGQYKWFEVVLVDPAHPAIMTDKDVGWICEKQHTKRALRGLTPAGKDGRGLRNKGKGAEKLRPSIRAKGRKGK
ncbi:MAG: 50S ribosomal protein L15e [Candidatus Altiarchaeales archaeon IMC4]|nr:MAG: 50S ribosomal protein L15e [Candidatus Altiarchaeales archaeon IMC4]